MNPIDAHCIYSIARQKIETHLSVNLRLQVYNKEHLTDITPFEANLYPWITQCTSTSNWFWFMSFYNAMWNVFDLFQESHLRQIFHNGICHPCLISAISEMYLRQCVGQTSPVCGCCCWQLPLWCTRTWHILHGHAKPMFYAVYATHRMPSIPLPTR